MCVQPILTITHLQNENGYDIDFQIGALIMSMQKLVTPRGWAKVDCSYRTTVPALNCESFTNSIYMHTLCIPACYVKEIAHAYLGIIMHVYVQHELISIAAESNQTIKH